VIKNWEKIRFRVALAFPDIYDIGFPNLGLAALYNIINARKDALAERVFSPWFDMEALLRTKNIPLFSLESHSPLNKFDLIGFTLPYETLYTNVLHMLDLASIPIRSKERSSSDPIIIAGGHATFNPAPMHAFIDAFVIGEGEAVVGEIIDALQQLSGKSRKTKLNALNQVPGVYVPAVLDSRIQKGILDHKHRVKKRIIKKIEKPITNDLVPNISVVHDRIAVEIMRGCSRGCRFCQAGMIMRPVRELEPDFIISSIKESIRKTGISEVSLLSLSTSDHSQINKIIEALDQVSAQKNINFSLPSLRIESFTKQMMGKMQSKRKGNFTIAPEAGSESRRAAINKPIPTEDILDTVEQICDNGWNNIKLYFMIGFPGETIDDIEAIIKLVRKIKNIGSNILKGRFKLHVSINTLIPKAHTPYQWAPLEKQNLIELKYQKLSDGLSPLRIKVNYPDFDLIKIEALLSRADRRISDLIYRAWEKGAKFDAWREGFSADIWHDAIDEECINLENYLYVEKGLDQQLPWDIVDIGISKTFLKQEYTNSLESKITPGCFQQCSACGVNKSFNIDCSKVRFGQI